jgi:cell division septation protein DedD
MRATYGEEDLAQLHTQSDRELTLSSTTLLVIFFGLVLICGLFFGFGYTLGRRSAVDAASQTASPQTTDSRTAETAQPTGTALQPAESRPKPSAAVADAAAEPDSSKADEPSADSAETASDADGATSRPAAPALVALPETSPEAKPSPKAADVTAAAQPAKPAVVQVALPSTASPGIIVQIAAITNPADADVLVGALHKRGYTAVARREAADSLIHVQVGPFSSRPEAIAMRQKLLGDGYNAILK